LALVTIAYILVSLAVAWFARAALLRALGVFGITIILNSVIAPLLNALQVVDPVRSGLAGALEECVRSFLSMWLAKDVLKVAALAGVLWGGVESWSNLSSFVQLQEQAGFLKSFQLALGHVDGDPLVLSLVILQPFLRMGVHIGLIYCGVTLLLRKSWLFPLIPALHFLLNFALSRRGEPNFYEVGFLTMAAVAVTCLAVAVLQHRTIRTV